MRVGGLLGHPSFATARPEATGAFPSHSLLSPEAVWQGVKSFRAYNTELSRCPAASICVMQGEFLDCPCDILI